MVRYQRNLLPDDPPDLCDGRTWGGCRFYPWLKNTPYKHAFLIESDDEGHTWKNFRQLTTVFGQTRGVPVARAAFWFWLCDRAFDCQLSLEHMLAAIFLR